MARLTIWAVLWLVGLSVPAMAMPQVFAATLFSVAGVSVTVGAVARVALTVGLSALERRKQRRALRGAGGVRSTFTTTGEDNAQTFILGRYATSGHHLCPPMTHGTGSVPNEYLTYVIALSDLPGCALHQVIVNDEVVTLGATMEARGLPATGDYAGKMWVRYFDGSQTTAWSWLTATYGVGTGHATDTGRPWQADMVGRSLCYAVVTFRLDQALFPGLPNVQFVLDGIPLYDPRKDSTAGGSGAHRWANRATWEPTNNPAVMIYNILRGVAVPGGATYGLGVDAPDLPAATWIAAANVCDETVDGAPRYQAGLEVALTDEPGAAIEELLKACAGDIAEVGGIWKLRVGGPGLPVYVFTDDDVVTDEENSANLFAGLAETYNAVTASFPSPAQRWATRDAPHRLDAAFEAEDGGRRLYANLSLPAVPYPNQVQRLMRSMLLDSRRRRAHVVLLPCDAAAVEPLDTVSWSSSQFGYVAKTFEVSESGDDLGTASQRLALREVDPADYSWSSGFALPQDVPSVVVRRPVSVPQGFAVAGATLLDATGAARRPGIQATWDGAEAGGFESVRWRARRGAVEIATGVVQADRGAVIIAAGIVGATPYEVSLSFVGEPGRPVDWTVWLPVTTPDVGLGNADFTGGLVATLQGLGVSPPERVAALPSTGNYEGRIVILTTNDKIYRHTGAPLDATGWTNATDGADILADSIAGNKLQVGSIGAREIAAYAMQVQNLAVTGGNLIGNPQFASGSFAAWRPYATPANQSVVVRSAAGVPAGAPTAFVARYDMSPAGAQLSTFSGENAFDVPGREACAIPVIAGEQYLFTVDVAKAAGVGNVLFEVLVFWLRANGDGATFTAAVSALSPSSWSTLRGSVQAPADAVGCWPYVFVNHQSGGTGAVFWSNMTMRQMAAGNLIVDGALSVQGMAAFGGTLQSSNFVSGSAGWRLQQSGALEIQNLINRSALTEDSLQDTFQTVNPLYYGTGGAPNIIVAGTVLATLNIGAVANGRLLRRGVNFEVRRPGTVSSFTNPQPRLELQSRKRQFGSGWSNWATERAWEGVDLYDGGSGVGPWDRKSSGGSISEGFDEFEYRVVVIDPRAYGNNGTWIGNIWLTVAYLTKGA